VRNTDNVLDNSGLRLRELTLRLQTSCVGDAEFPNICAVVFHYKVKYSTRRLKRSTIGLRKD